MNETGMGLSIPKITKRNGKLVAESTALVPVDLEDRSEKETQFKQEFTWLCAQKGYAIKGEIRVDYQKSIIPGLVCIILCGYVEPGKKGRRAARRSPLNAALSEI
jgi:hypothetical protein